VPAAGNARALPREPGPRLAGAARALRAALCRPRLPRRPGNQAEARRRGGARPRGRDRRPARSEATSAGRAGATRAGRLISTTRLEPMHEEPSAGSKRDTVSRPRTDIRAALIRVAQQALGAPGQSFVDLHRLRV